MAILITGGAGYIGSHVCVELLNAGFEVIVIDNLYNSNIESLRRVNEITGRDFIFKKIDLLDRDSLDGLFAEHSIEAVIHCAGLKAVGESFSMPIHYYHNNVSGTLVLCEVMKKYKVFRIVFSSSATVYGTSNRVPVNESCSLHATNPYGRSKQIVEEILQDLYISDQRWSITLLRYFNPIGAHVSGRIGEDPRGIPSNLVPYITQVMVGKLKRLTIYGNDYPTHDGTGIRDFIHVVDLAVGHVKALHKAIDTQGVHIYNLGTGRGYSVMDMLTTFEKISGRRIPYIFEQRRPGDVAISYADPNKARLELDWTAERSIEQMCEDSWRWQLDNPEGYLIDPDLVTIDHVLARYG